MWVLVSFKTKIVLSSGSEGLVAIVTFHKTLPGILLNLASEASMTQYCLSQEHGRLSPGDNHSSL